MPATEQGIAAGKQRYHLIPRALVFIFNADGHVLLLKGAPTKKIWANMYNGIGGHIERGEDPRTAALREIYEETGLTPTELTLCGIIHIDAGDPALGISMTIFRAFCPSGDPIPSPEGDLHWLDPAQLTGLPLVADIEILLQRITAPNATFPFFGRYWYENDIQHIEIDGQRLLP